MCLLPQRGFSILCAPYGSFIIVTGDLQRCFEIKVDLSRGLQSYVSNMPAFVSALTAFPLSFPLPLSDVWKRLRKNERACVGVVDPVLGCMQSRERGGLRWQFDDCNSRGRLNSYSSVFKHKSFTRELISWNNTRLWEWRFMPPLPLKRSNIAGSE